MRISAIARDLTAPLKHYGEYKDAVREARFLAENGVLNSSLSSRNTDEGKLRAAWLQDQLDREKQILMDNLDKDLKRLRQDLNRGKA